jgi:hypothetical protein
MKKQIETLVKLCRIETETVDIKQMLDGLSGKMDAIDLRVEELEQNLGDEAVVLEDLKKKIPSL